MPNDGFPVMSVANHTVLITVAGKLRGRCARQLGSRLLDLAEEGVTRVVIDMTTLTSLDSMGTFSLEEGLDAGLRLHLVVRPSFRFDGFFTSRSLSRRGLRIHHDVEEALLTVRQIIDSGVVLVG